MALTSAIASGTASATTTVTCLGPTVFVVTDGLADGETVQIHGEDLGGNYTDLLYTFDKNTPESVLIETYRVVQITKSVTAASVAVGYGS